MKIISKLPKVVKVIIFILLFWIAVHFLVLGGLIIVLLYPVWYLLFPHKTLCFICYLKKDGKYCPFCKKSIQRKVSLTPSHLRSAILNSGMIFCFVIFSLGFVYVENKALESLGLLGTQKTASFVIPSKGQYKIGEIFPMKIEMTNFDNPINAVQADIGFDADKVEVVEISTAGSFANIFIQKEINNAEGWARLTGGLPNPGFDGQRGSFGVIYLRGKNPGVVNIKFLESSMVLANDGKGTNILKEFPAASYLIVPEAVTPKEEENQFSYLSQEIALAKKEDSESMVFFEEGSVLGLQTPSTLEEENNQNIFSNFAVTIKKLDTFLLSFYEKIR